MNLLILLFLLEKKEYITLNNEIEVIYHVEDPTEPFNQVMYVEKELGNYVATLVGSTSETLSKTMFEVWGLHFDGAKSRRVTGAGVVLTSPKGEVNVYSFILEFDCTNNIVEYEALLIGLELATELKVKQLKVIGDYDLIVSQVKEEFSRKNHELKKYRNVVWDSIETFDAFSIKVAPRK